MGVYLDFLRARAAQIPEDLHEEFRERAVDLLWRGGLIWARTHAPMTGLSAHRGCCGVHASYGRQADVDYSYFDDGLRENAGVAVTPDGTPCIYSGKVRGFSGDAIAAVYTLQGAYLDGPFVVVCNESPWVDEEMDDIADWVQHIVPDHFVPAPVNLWNVYEAALRSVSPIFAGEGWKDYRERDVLSEAWHWARSDGERFLSAGEVLSVIEGARFWLRGICASRAAQEHTGTTKINADMCLKLASLLDDCTSHSTLAPEEQFRALRDAWVAAATGSDAAPDGHAAAAGASAFAETAARLGAPALTAALLCQEFEVDFWETWEKLPPQVRTPETGYLAPIHANSSMTTNELFEVSDDDRIPWWTPGCRMRFSEMCKRQLRKFRAMYEEAGSRRSSVRLREKDVYRILTETTHRFGRVYAFEPFVEESLSDLNAPETRAMWRVLQELIDDRELLDEAEVIFKPGEPHIRDLGDPLGGMSNYKSIWEGIPLSERKNPGRMTIRRYLALVGNRALREKVLGC